MRAATSSALATLRASSEAHVREEISRTHCNRSLEACAYEHRHAHQRSTSLSFFSNTLLLQKQ